MALTGLRGTLALFIGYWILAEGRPGNRRTRRHGTSLPPSFI